MFVTMADTNSFSSHANHLTDRCRAVQHFLDGGFAQRTHAHFTARVEELDAVGLLGNQAANRVGDWKNLEDAVAPAVARLPAVQTAAPFFERALRQLLERYVESQRLLVGRRIFFGAVRADHPHEALRQDTEHRRAD